MKNIVFDHSLSQTILISIVYPLGPATVILMPLIVGGVIDDYGFSDQQAGTMASLEGLGLVCGLLLGAQWVRKLSWRKILFIGFLLYAVLNVISASIQAFTLLVSIRFLTGFTGGSIFAIVVAALGDNKEPDRAFGIGQGVQGAMMFAVFAAAPYILEGRTIGTLFYILAAGSLAMLLSLFYFPDKGIEHNLMQGGEQSKDHTLLIWSGLIAGLIYYASIFGFWGFVERIGMAAGLGTETISIALGVSQIAAIAGGFIAAYASDRYGRVLPLVIVIIGQFFVLWQIIGEFTLVMYFIGTCLYQSLYIIATCYFLGVIAVLDDKGKYVVIMNAFLGIGVAAGPSIAAVLIKGDDYSGINKMAGLGILISIGIFLFIIHRSRALTNTQKTVAD
jgi:predicted MFS family arabinose efflux permease